MYYLLKLWRYSARSIKMSFGYKLRYTYIGENGVNNIEGNFTEQVSGLC